MAIYYSKQRLLYRHTVEQLRTAIHVIIQEEDRVKVEWHGGGGNGAEEVEKWRGGGRIEEVGMDHLGSK